MSSRTPGPWQFKVHRVSCSVRDMHGVLLARLPAADDGQQRVEDARMMAAAPDLLRALVRYVADDAEGARAQTLRWLGAVAAIRKATGGSA